MKFYQDFIGYTDKAAAVVDCVDEYKGSAMFRTAVDAKLYYDHLNPTINRYEKYIHNALGQSIKDEYSANSKVASSYFPYFINQEVQYLLGNGVSFGEDGTKAKLGSSFDRMIQDAATSAQVGGAAYCFANFDHIEVFTAIEFCPLYDEENGALMAGIRFWQIAPDKPVRYTLYEADGVTDYIKRSGDNVRLLADKHGYKQTITYSPADGMQIYDGGNYPSFPIVPLYAVNKLSRLVGTQSALDAYDLMLSQLVNNVSEGSVIYWVLKNCGGMSEAEMEEYVTRVVRTHVSQAGDEEGSSAEPHTVETPFQANQAALEQLRKTLFDSFMALDVTQLQAGNVTATQIKAAYEPLNQYTDKFEYQVTDCIMGILQVFGIKDAPTYTRSAYANQGEEIEQVLSAQTVLPAEYIAEKVVAALGDIDRRDEILGKVADGTQAAGFERA